MFSSSSFFLEKIFLRSYLEIVNDYKVNKHEAKIIISKPRDCFEIKTTSIIKNLEEGF